VEQTAARQHLEACTAPAVPNGRRVVVAPSAVAATLTSLPAGSALAEVGIGVVHLQVGTTVAAPTIAAEVSAVQQRVKALFDPAGRLNPGVVLAGTSRP
jgi:FAD/FMN-containing dehydrogenase